MMEDSKTPDPADVTLIEHVGVGRIADALGISEAAVRKWRKTGIPESRQQAILALVDTKEAAAEQLSLVDVGTSTPESDGEDQRLVSDSGTELRQDIGDTSVVERNTRARRTENARAAFLGSQAQSQPTSATKDSKARPPIAKMAAPKAMQQRKPVRLNRQTAILVGSGLVAAIAIGLTQGLRDVSSSPASISETVEQVSVYQGHVSAVLPDFNYRTLTRPAALNVIKEPPKKVENSHVKRSACRFQKPAWKAPRSGLYG